MKNVLLLSALFASLSLSLNVNASGKELKKDSNIISLGCEFFPECQPDIKSGGGTKVVETFETNELSSCQSWPYCDVPKARKEENLV